MIAPLKPTANRILLSVPHMGGTELQYVEEAFNSNWLSTVGPNLIALEREFSNIAGLPSVALASGTAGIHLGLKLLGVKANTSASVDHDCVIGSHTHLCPGVRLAGGVSIGSLTMIGTGASVLPGIAIGSHCVIGAGSVVTKNVPDCSIVCGVPARPVKT